MQILSHTTVVRCEEGEQLQEGGDYFDMSCSKPHKPVIVAIARRLVTIANAILITGVPWRQNTVT